MTKVMLEIPFNLGNFIELTPQNTLKWKNLKNYWSDAEGVSA